MTVDVVGGDVAGGQDREGARVSEPSLGRSRILGLGPDGELRSSRKQLNAEPREYAHSDLYSYFFTLSLLNVIFLENFYPTSIYTVQKWLMILFFLYILNIKHGILNPWPLVKKDLSFRLFLAFATEQLIDDIHCMLVKDASLLIMCDLFHCKDKYEQIVWIPLENPPNVYFLVSCCLRKYRNLHPPVWVLLVLAQAMLIQLNETKQSSLHETLLIQNQQLVKVHSLNIKI